MWRAVDKYGSEIPEDVEVQYGMSPLKKVNLKSAKSNSSETVTLKWAKVAGADGYEIQYKDSGTWDDTIDFTVKSGSKTKRNIDGLYSFYKYTFRIRAYKKIGNVKNYSEWSAVKKCSPKS